jgi:hypothetical protein
VWAAQPLTWSTVTQSIALYSLFHHLSNWERGALVMIKAPLSSEYLQLLLIGSKDDIRSEEMDS